MNRIDRLTAILTHLQSKRLVKASEIAQRFDISLRTVYRDIRALEEAGIPIIGEAGMGYSLVEGYRLPPVMFTREEAVAFLMAEKIMEKITDKGSGMHIQSAMFKIKSVLRSTEKAVIDDMSSNIQVIRKNNALHTVGKDKSLQSILSGLADRKVTKIKYTTFENEETTIRPIEPIGVYYAYEQWYLIAWCRLRKDYRTFRVDRISNIETTDETFKNRHPSLNAYLKKMENEENLNKVIVKVHRSVVKYLKGQRYNHGFVMEQQNGDYVEMTFMTSALEGFARWLIMMADQVRIVQPQALKNRIQELLETMLENQKKY